MSTRQDKASSGQKKPSDGLDLYKHAGVDVEGGDALVEWLQESGQTQIDNKYGAQVSGIGGFAALFRPNFSGMKDPLLVTSTDGVGTKVLLGLETRRLEGLGVDLVAMCVNDLYCVGARPLFFLDYFATGVLNPDDFKAVLTGIRRGCRQSNAHLIGGETAELPGLYAKGHFDLAGFVVGVVDGAAMLGAHNVRVGDVLVSLASSGFHSNGYSLIRHWLKNATPSPELVERLMTPTRIYHEVPELVSRFGTDGFHALANITGGGISGNLPRVLPENVEAVIQAKELPTQAWVKEFIEAQGSQVLQQEAVFNLGVGMVGVVAKDRAKAFIEACASMTLEARVIGDVRSGQGEATVRFE